jgi:hypothetical protein
VRFDSYAVLPRLRNARLYSERLRRLKTDRIDLYPGHQKLKRHGGAHKARNGPRPGSWIPRPQVSYVQCSIVQKRWRRETYGTGREARIGNQ